MSDFKYVLFKDQAKVTLKVLIDSFEYTIQVKRSAFLLIPLFKVADIWNP